MSIGQQRNASAMRQAVLVIILIVVGCAFAYDKLVASKNRDKAWEEIKKVEASDKAGATTNKDMHDLLGDPVHSEIPDDHPKMLVALPTHFAGK